LIYSLRKIENVEKFFALNRLKIHFYYHYTEKLLILSLDALFKISSRKRLKISHTNQIML